MHDRLLLGQMLEQRSDAPGACEQYETYLRALGTREAEERHGPDGASTEQGARLPIVPSAHAADTSVRERTTFKPRKPRRAPTARTATASSDRQASTRPAPGDAYTNILPAYSQPCSSTRDRLRSLNLQFVLPWRALHVG